MKRLIPPRIIYWLSGMALMIPLAAQAQVPPEDPLQGDGRVSAFYTWTGALPEQPGRLLRSEPLPAVLGLAGAGRQLRILYSATNGVTGKGVVAVSGAVFLPKGDAPKGGWPIMAWAHGTVGVADVCAPSWAGRSLRDVRYLNTWLDQGYAVVASDYQGLGVPGPHPYLHARAAAYGVLDSVRAALQANLQLANKVVIIGQSQGGGATLASAAFAPAYAPDVNVVGAVATGAPYFTPKVSTQTGGSTHPGAVGYMMYSVLSAQQGNASLNADEVLTPAARPLLERARIRCVAELMGDAEVQGLTLANAFQPGMLEKMFAPMFATLMYPTVKLAMPVFIGTGDKDTEVPPQLQQLLAGDACKAGSTVAFHVYPGEDHSSTVNLSLADSIPFVRKVFAGERIAARCPTEK